MSATWPVFVSTGADSLFVGGIAHSVVGYWLRQREADPVVILDWGVDPRWWDALAAWGHRPGSGKLVRVPMSRDGSQRSRHALALQHAHAMGATWCVSTDDDILPRAECSLASAVRLLETARTTQPAFGLPAGAPYGLVSVKLPACTLPHVLTPAMPYGGPPIREAGAMGGFRFLSARLDPELFPPYEPERCGYDVLLCDAVRAQGLAVGVFWDSAPLGLRAKHLREGYSTVWPYQGLPDTLPRQGAATDA